jgi:phage tail tape-measure protein
LQLRRTERVRDRFVNFRSKGPLIFGGFFIGYIWGMATLSTNDIKIRYDIDLSKLQQATSEFDKITAEERQLLAELGKLKKQFDDVGDKAKKAGKDAGDSMGGLGQAISKVGPVIAGVFAADKIVGFAKEVIAVTAQFQKFESVLKNTLGSNSAAQGALASIKQFAATTPFSVQEVTDSFVKLAGVGFKPSIEQMRKLGDVASSQGKSFLQYTEAILDARNFEFERLKELNISARTVGENVIFNFKGVETQVKKNRDAVQQYLISLGDYNGVAGSSSAVSQTLGGQISNLGDNWDSLLTTIGNNLAPIFGKALTVTSEFLASLNELFKGEQQILKEFQGNQYTAYTNFFTNTSDQALKNIEANSKRNIAIKEAELKDLKIKAAEERAIREQVAAESRVAVDIGAGRLELLAIKEEKYLEALKAQNQAAIDEINKRAEANKKASEDQTKADKDEYNAKLKLYELEKQQQILMA